MDVITCPCNLFQSKFNLITQDINLQVVFEIYRVEITASSPRGQCVKYSSYTNFYWHYLVKSVNVVNSSGSLLIKPEANWIVNSVRHAKLNYTRDRLFIFYINPDILDETEQGGWHLKGSFPLQKKVKHMGNNKETNCHLIMPNATSVHLYAHKQYNNTEIYFLVKFKTGFDIMDWRKKVWHIKIIDIFVLFFFYFPQLDPLTNSMRPSDTYMHQ